MPPSSKCLTQNLVLANFHSKSARHYERHRYKVLRERKLEDAIRSHLSSAVASREGNLVVAIKAQITCPL